MRIYYGKSVYGGIAIGRIKVHSREDTRVKRIRVDQPEEEIRRYHQAKQQAEEELKELYEKACAEVGDTNAAIFEIHQMMLEDGDYQESVLHIIRTQSVNAEYAIATTGRNFSNMFSSMDNPYMQARADDVKDISERLLKILTGTITKNTEDDEPMILVAEDLVPSETVQLDKSKVLAFVTAKGSANSHTAILARTMNIPAIVGIDIPVDETTDGVLAVVNGARGIVYLDPEPEVLERMREKQREEEEQRGLLQSLKGKETVTADGKKICLYANIGNSKDLALVLQNDAEGIGLFRSEFIYLERESLPTEEEQFRIYKSVAETMAEKKTIIRTLDIGADKQAEYLELEPEENPALGLRAIRLCLTRPELFKTQLRALFRAAAFGDLAVMYPMITSVQEIVRIHQVVDEVVAELNREEIPFRVPEQGIMIETPAAVMMSEELAQQVDFFSIGTNDLAQYTMAIDRQNPRLDQFFDPQSEAVLRMIEMTITNAHKSGIWVGICGELGADTTLTQRFLNMGVDELSVAPSQILAVRKVVRETKLK